jgi:predicted  nucleic acid-binding Zn-ribbon protein
MNESIRQLLNVQVRDTEYDRLKAEAGTIPAKVAAIKTEIQANKTALETAKKDLTTFQLAKKQKEMDLDTREGAIRKHSGELNAVKTNEAYRALTGEIDKAKQEKSILEDELLILMEKIDQASKIWKDKESSAKSIEDGLQGQISTLEGKQKDLETQAEQKHKEREEVITALPAKLREPYESLREHKRTNAVVPIRNGQCTGCHMSVSPNLANEVNRGLKLMTCESCARIVYIEEAPVAAPVAPATEAK